MTIKIKPDGNWSALNCDAIYVSLRFAYLVQTFVVLVQMMSSELLTQLARRKIRAKVKGQ
jgi:hypothetical protein